MRTRRRGAVISGATKGRPRPSVEKELGQFADFEDLGAAVGAGPLDRRPTVLHGHLLGVLDLDLLALLDAVTLWHGHPSFVGLTASTVGALPDATRHILVRSATSGRAGGAS